MVAFEAGQHVAFEHVAGAREFLLCHVLVAELGELTCEGVDELRGVLRRAGSHNTKKAGRLDVRLSSLHAPVPIKNLAVEARIHALPRATRREGLHRSQQDLHDAERHPVLNVFPGRHPRQRHMAELAVHRQLTLYPLLAADVWARDRRAGRMRALRNCAEVPIAESEKLVVVHPCANQDHPGRLVELLAVLTEHARAQVRDSLWRAVMRLPEGTRRAEGRLVNRLLEQHLRGQLLRLELHHHLHLLHLFVEQPRDEDRLGE
mmetsp:Transcript_93174/g.266248  ORF Transcript_93174/g.266248 Transcript_93174/m.266248 type:complete len:262 (+) Transcript_93174:4326-5111(+)